MKSVAPLTRRAFVAAVGASVPSVVFGQSFTPGRPYYPRGAVLPKGLINRMAAQNATAQAINQRVMAEAAVVEALRTANPRLLLPPPTTMPAQYMAQVTAIKDQGICGDCWAFAAVGAFEASFLIMNKQPISVSEQELLDCTFGDTNCITGSFHEVGFLYLQNYGEVSESSYPYTQVKGICISNMPRTYSLLNWGYVRSERRPEDALIATEDAIKQAIYRYGPVATAVQADNWDTYIKADGNGVANPSWPANGIFNGQASSKLKAGQVDHDVLIVGWDDTVGDGVWIIKNSWGKSWGDGGYMRLPYGHDNVGTGAAWALSNLPQVSKSLAGDLEKINRSNKLREFYPGLAELR
jgi:hypothetical protein